MRQISALGQSQLAAWEEIADEWIMVPTWREEFASKRGPEYLQLHMVCAKCSISVYAISEQSITPAVFKAATVAHIRNHHRELDPDA